MKPRPLALGIFASCIVLVTMVQPHAQPGGRSAPVVTGLTDVVWSMRFSPDNRTLALARGPSDAGRIELWDVETGTLRRAIKGFDGPVWSLSFAPDGRTLVSGSSGIHSNKIPEKLARRDGVPFVELKWWDSVTGDLKQRVELPGDDGISLMAAYSPDGRSLATVEYRASTAFSRFDSSASLDIARSRGTAFPMLRSMVYEADLKLLDATTGDLRVKLKGSIGSFERPFFPGRSVPSEMFSMFAMNQRRLPLAFSPDGQLVAGWNTSEVKLWNAATGAEIRRLKDFKGRLSAVAFSPDGRSLAAAITKISVSNGQPDLKSEVRIWDITSGAPTKVLPVTTQSISSMVFALNGRQLLLGGLVRDERRSFATLELADLNTGSLGTLEAREEGSASAVVLSPNGRMVAFQTDATSVHLIDAETWKIKQTFTETSDSSSINTVARRFLLSVKSVRALAFSADGKTVSGEIEQGGIRLWDSRTGEVKKQLADHTDTGSIAAMSADGNFLAEVGADDETLRGWNTASGEQRAFAASEGSLTAIAVSADGQRLAVVHPGLITLLNTATSEVTQKLNSQLQKINCLSFSNDGQTLALATEDGTIQTVALPSGQITRTMTGGGRINALRFAPGGRLLASADGDGGVDLWDLQTGTLRLKLRKHSATVNAIAFSADGNLMATGGDDRTVIIWDTASGKPRHALKGHDLAVTCVAFSPDGSLLASGAGNASVALWNVSTGKLDRVLK